MIERGRFWKHSYSWLCGFCNRRVGQDVHAELKPAPARVPVLLPPDFFARILKRIDMHHPSENHGVEGAAGFGAGFLGKNRALQSEFRPVGAGALVLRGDAQLFFFNDTATTE